MAVFTTSSIAVSGMQAGFRRFHVSADNIARRHVTNSEKNRVIQQADQYGGVDTTVQKIPMDESLKVDASSAGSLEALNASNIDYAEEAVMQTVSKVATQASFAVYNTSKEMDESLLNITA